MGIRSAKGHTTLEIHDPLRFEGESLLSNKGVSLWARQSHRDFTASLSEAKNSKYGCITR